MREWDIFAAAYNGFGMWESLEFGAEGEGLFEGMGEGEDLFSGFEESARGVGPAGGGVAGDCAFEERLFETSDSGGLTRAEDSGNGG